MATIYTISRQIRDKLAGCEQAKYFGSWFLESPWKKRRGIALAGDILLMVVVAAAAFLFAWQQWFTSFTRPVVAMLQIEATDTRDDTQLLANHRAERIRMLLATRAEIRVIELSSSHHMALNLQPTVNKAEILNADFLIAGTLSRGREEWRLTLELGSTAPRISRLRQRYWVPTGRVAGTLPGFRGADGMGVPIAIERATGAGVDRHGAGDC